MIFDFFISSFLLRYNFEFSRRKEEDCRWIWELCEKAQVWCRSGSPTILLQHPSPQHSWHEYAQVSDLYQTLSRIQVFSHFGDFATNLKTNDQSTKTGQTLVRIGLSVPHCKYFVLCTGWTSSFSTWQKLASEWVGLTLILRGFEPTPRCCSLNLSSPSTAFLHAPTLAPLRPAWAWRKRCEQIKGFTTPHLEWNFISLLLYAWTKFSVSFSQNMWFFWINLNQT